MTTDRFIDDYLSIAEVEKINSLFEGVSNYLRISFVNTSDELIKLEK